MKTGNIVWITILAVAIFVAFITLIKSASNNFTHSSNNTLFTENTLNRMKSHNDRIKSRSEQKNNII